MSRFTVILGVAAAGIAALFFSPLWAGEIVLRYDFDRPQLSKVGEYDFIEIPGLVSTANAGLPVLPIRPVQVLLPAGEEIVEVEVNPGEEYSLGTGFVVKPGDRQYPLSYEGPCTPQPPDPSVYNSNALYPEAYHRIVTVGRANGFAIASFNLFPVRYIPKAGELRWVSSLELVLRTTPSSYALEATRKLLRTTEKVQHRIADMVENPGEISSYFAVAPIPSGGSKGLVNPEDSYQYVIITVPTFQVQFEDFADYKSARGLRGTVVLLSDILAEYTGRDNAEEVRNFIIDAYQSWETEYVLLGGDYGTLPTRKLYATVSGYTDHMPGDTYFASLDGDWNSDGDSYWGEESPEEADLYPDIGVGRITADNSTELARTLHKTTMYETQPVESECLDALMAGEVLWSDPTWGADYKEEIRLGSSAHGYTTVGFPSRFNVTTLYDKDLNPGYIPGLVPFEWTKDDLIAILNDGMPIVNHLGHCNIGYAMRMFNPDVDSRFTNDGVNDSYFFVYTQGCKCNYFDDSGTESISERFIAVENAAFAFLGNTRYGWGKRASTDGASQYYDRQFFDAVWGENIFALANADNDSKADNVPFIGLTAHRWCHYELCLLGDPALELWTNSPANLTVTHDDTYVPGQGEFVVQVSGRGSPVKGALVCLYTDGYDHYVRGYTNASGRASLDPDIVQQGTVHVSVVAHDFYQYEADVPIAEIADIDLDPISWTEVVFEGDSEETYLQVINAGTGILDYALSVDVGWLRFDPAQGLVSPGDTAVVTLTVDATSLPPAWYSTSVQAASNDPDEGLLQLPFTLAVPQYRFENHDAGNVTFCLTDGGCYGYWDRDLSYRFGDGFQYPSGGPGVPSDYLVHGSFWAGTGPDRVIDGSCDYDWQTLGGGKLVVEDGTPEIGTARYDDSRAPSPLGLSVFQESFAWAGPPDDDYVILRYDVKNTGTQDIDGLYLGLYMDWNVSTMGTLDNGGFDSGLSLGYLFDSGGGDNTHVGVASLSDIPTSFRFIHNPTYSWPMSGHIDDIVKFYFMSCGIIDDVPSQPDDWSMVTSVGPISLAAGDSTSLAFAVVAGTGLNDLKANAMAAKQRLPGDIDLDPESWTEVVFEGEITKTYLNVVNAGMGTLDFAISAEESDPPGLKGSFSKAWLEAAERSLHPPWGEVAGGTSGSWAPGESERTQDEESPRGSVPWLSINPTGGSVSPGDTAVVELTVDGASLTPAWYAANIRVESNDLDEAQIDLPFWLAVPHYRFDSHDAGNVVFCVTDGGCYGYFDQDLSYRFGDGFQYPAADPADPKDYLAYGSFWAGTGPDRMMDGSCDYDWETVAGGELIVDEGPPEKATAVFEDSGAPSPLGLSVSQRSVARADSPDDDYVIMSLDVANTSVADIDDLYLSLFMDWDVSESGLDSGSFDSDLSLGYQLDSQGEDGTYVGVALLSPTAPSSFRFIHNPTYSYPHYGHIEDTDKYDFVSSGTVDGTTGPPDDWSMVMSVGPLSLAAGDTTSVAFALVAGTGLQDLEDNTASARAALPPDIGIEIASWDGVVFEGDSTETYLNLVNTGTEPLEFTVWAEEGTALRPTLASDETFTAEVGKLPPLSYAGRGARASVGACSGGERDDTLTRGVPWLVIEPEQGTVATGDSAVVTLTADGSTLTPGLYSAVIYVQSNDPDQPVADLPFTVAVPHYRFDSHDAGKVTFCVTDGGCFGYWDKDLLLSFGDGFQYPADDPERYLAHGSFWAGTAPDRVMDTSCDYDWQTLPDGKLLMEEGPPQRGTARYDDSGAPSPLGLSVFQESIARADPPDDDYVILTFGVCNTSPEDISNLYLGLFMDWDVCRTDTLDLGGYDSDLSLGYLFDSLGEDSTYVGVALLTPCPPGEAGSFRFIHSPTYCWPDTGHISDAEKYDFVSSGVVDHVSDYPSDWSTVMAVGPISLGAGDSTFLTFAVVAGTGLQDLRANANSARQALGYADVPAGPEPRLYWGLGQNYPNPPNPTTTIRFGLAERAHARLAIFDVTGRLVRYLVDTEMPAGFHEVCWDGSNEKGRQVSSGVFFCLMKAGDFQDSRKIIVVR